MKINLSKSRNRGEVVIYFVFFVFCMVFLVMGYKLGKSVYQFDAINHGVAHYIVNPTTGEVKYEYINVNTNNWHNHEPMHE